MKTPCHFCGEVKDTIPICAECYGEASVVEAVREFLKAKDAFLKSRDDGPKPWLTKNQVELMQAKIDAESRLRDLVGEEQ